MPFLRSYNGKSTFFINNINGLGFQDISNISHLTFGNGLIDEFKGATLALSTRKLTSEWNERVAMEVCPKNDITNTLEVYFTSDGWLDTGSIHSWAVENNLITTDTFDGQELQQWGQSILVKKWYNQAFANSLNADCVYFELPTNTTSNTHWIDGPLISNINADEPVGQNAGMFVTINGRPAVNFRNQADPFGDNSIKSYMNSYNPAGALGNLVRGVKATRPFAYQDDYFISCVWESPYSHNFNFPGGSDTNFRSILMQFDITEAGAFQQDATNGASEWPRRLGQWLRFTTNKGRTAMASNHQFNPATTINTTDDGGSTNYTNNIPYIMVSVADGVNSTLKTFDARDGLTGASSGLNSPTNINSNQVDGNWPFGGTNLGPNHFAMSTPARLGCSSNIGGVNNDAGATDLDDDSFRDVFGSYVINGGWSGNIGELIFFGENLQDNTNVTSYTEYTSSVLNEQGSTFNIAVTSLV